MVGSAPTKAPWDQRLIEHLARGSWEAANDPARRRRNPSFREQIRSPYYWFSVLAFGAAVLIWLLANPGWLHALAGVLYVVALIATALARRDARAIGLE
jgi:Flp pilus assembly protein TadB